MRTPEFGAVDPVTARNINIIERDAVVCELCGIRRQRPVTDRDMAIVTRPITGITAHRKCHEDREVRA